MVLTNRNHDGGTKLQYIHVPRHPHYCLPAKISDQLSHGVIKPRILKHMRASNYSNTYQMIEQNGSFQGIDTCDVTDVGKFNLTSRLLNESESRTIHSRPDINALLQKMADKRIITQESVSERRDEAKRLYPTQECLEDYYYGSTYVSLNDAILTQKDIGDHKLLNVLIDVNRNDNQQYRISCKRNWPSHVYIVQKFDKKGFGVPFVPIVKCTLRGRDTRVLWILIGLLSRVRESWKATEKFPLK